MKFKIGDKVRVRSDLIEYREYGKYVFRNPELLSSVLTVKEIDGSSYILTDSNGKTYGQGYDTYWTDEMLEEVKVNKLVIEGKEIELSDETVANMKKQFKDLIEKDDDVVAKIGERMMMWLLK